jgi:putative DNA primase/helicase
MTVEKKGKDPYKLRTYSKFFFSANSLPRLGKGKDTAAVMSRLVVIPFEAKFDKKSKNFDPFIKKKLVQDEVMEALIIKALEGLQEVLMNQAFEVCDKINASMEEYERTNNPILNFFDELDEADYMNEPVKKVYREYNSFCLSNNLQALSSIEFNKQMKNHFNIIIKNVEVNGQKVRCFVNEEQ